MLFFFFLTVLAVALPNLLLYAGDESSLQAAINSMFNETSTFCKCTMNPREIVFQALTNQSFDWITYVDEFCDCDLPNHFNTKPPPQPVQLPGYLHALMDSGTREIYAVSYNISDLEQLRQTRVEERDIMLSNTTASVFEIVALTSENVTSLSPNLLLSGTRTEAVPPDLTERDWSSVATWVIAYAAGGAVLHAVDRHTRSGVVRNVYKVYAALGYDVAYFISDVATNIYQGFQDAQNNHWGTAFTAEGAMRENSVMGLIEVRQVVEYLSKRTCESGDPSWCEEFEAPCVKSDICTSRSNYLGYYDTDQWWDWAWWYGEEMTSDSTWGTSFLHIQWDLGLSSYWVASMSTRPNSDDSTMAFEDCDSAPWKKI